MQITVSGQQMDLTDAIRTYTEQKFHKLSRHFDQVININVVLSVEKSRQKAEANLTVSGTHLHANAETNDMYATIDALIDKLDRQILKYKEKMRDHHKSDVQKRA